MRLREFAENKALDAAIGTMKKTFNPQRSAVQNRVNDVIRSVQMGKGDPEQQRIEILDIIKDEQDALRADPELKYSVQPNLKMLKRALNKLGVSEAEVKITKRMGNKIQAGDGIEIDLDKVDVSVDPTTKKSKIKPKGSVPGAQDPKAALKPGQSVELS